MRHWRRSGVRRRRRCECQTDNYFVLASLDRLPTNAIAPTHESTHTIPMTGPMCVIESVSMCFLRVLPYAGIVP